MGANEPCAEDLIPKNRQNNVYGHGHVEGLPSLLEAANYVYELDTNIILNASTPVSEDNRVYLSSSESFEVSVTGGAAEVQWRTWDMRDNWMSHPNFSPGDTNFDVSYKMLVDRIQYLPGNQIEGNQTLMFRAILDDGASTNLVTHVFLLSEDNNIPTQDRGLSGFTSLIGIISVLGAAIIIAGNRKD
jgi:hypothetical protein